MLSLKMFPCSKETPAGQIGANLPGPTANIRARKIPPVRHRIGFLGVLGILGLLVALVGIACGGAAAPAPTAAQTAAPAALPRPTQPPPVVRSAALTTPTPAPTASPALVPVAPLPPTPNVRLLPSSREAATPVPDPTPTPVPTVAPVPAVTTESTSNTATDPFDRLIQDLPWATDNSFSNLESGGLALLQGLLNLDQELATQITAQTWVIDGIDAGEQQGLAALRELAALNPDSARRTASFPWVIDGLTPEEQQALKSLAGLAAKDESAGIQIINRPWVADGISVAEEKALRNLRAIPPSLLGPVSGFPWVLDGIADGEWQALGNLANLAQDPTLGETLAALPWIADDITDVEGKSLTSINQARDIDPALARQLAQLPWVRQDIDATVQLSLAYLTAIAQQDPDLARQLAAMPFLTGTLAASDQNSLASLHRLAVEFPKHLKLLREQEWFQDGLDQAEAVFVTVLGRHVYYDGSDPKLPAAFADLAPQHLLDRRQLELPLTGPINLYGFYLDPQVDTRNFMDQMEQAVRDMEGFMGYPLPTKDIILLFASPGESNLGVNMTTHMVVTPDPQADKERFKVIVHEVGHFYWSGASSDTPQRGVPLWFQEGGANFLASYVFSLSNHPLRESLTDTEAKLSHEIRYCNTQGITRLQQLIDTVDRAGYQEHQQTPQFICNYWVGESFFLNLYATVGHPAFVAAWQEIYLLAQTAQRPVTEAEIFDAFLRNTPAAQADALRQLYDTRHGGKF